MRIGWCLLPWANQRHGKENGYLSDPEPARASELATTCTKRRLRVSAARVATLTACAGARSFDEQVHGADLSARFKSLPHPVDAYGTYALARPLITADVHFEALVAWRKAAMAHFSRPAVQDRRKIRKKAGRQASQGIFRVLPEPKSSQRNLPRCRQPPSPSERMSTPPTVAHSAAAPAVEPKHKSPRMRPSPNVERRREAGHQRQHARRHPARVLHMDSLPAASSGTARRQPEPEGTPNGKKPMPHWLHRVAIARSALDAKRRKATERTHLLDSKPGQESVIEKLVYGETDAEALVGFNRELAATEFRPLSMLAAQMLVSNMIDFFPGFLSGVLTGHLSTTMSSEYIAARSLAGVFMMITGYTVNIAIGAAMDTLCAQAYGAGKLREMGIFFQTGLLLFAGCFVPVSLVSYFCVDILELLGQRREIAQLVYRLVLYVLPSLPFSIVNSLLCKILQGQNIIKPMVYAGIVANVVHGVLIYVFMFHTSVGYAGSSLANSALVACYTLTLAIYFCRSHLYQREWPGWRLRDALALVPEFVRLGFSGLCMFIFEYWGFAAASLLAGLLPYAAVAISADSTYSSFRVLCAQFYGTISIAGSVRVGNALGANDPERAKTAAFLSVGLSVICALLTSIVMVGLRGIYPFAYTTDAAVVAATSRLMLLTCPFQIFFGISASVQGIFRGSGLQVLGARLNFFCFLALAVPMGLTLAFPLGMGLLGLWFGLCTGSVASGGYCLYWLLIADWNSMAAEAQKRTQEPDDLREDEAESLKAEQELRAGDVASYC